MEKFNIKAVIAVCLALSMTIGFNVRAAESKEKITFSLIDKKESGNERLSYRFDEIYYDPATKLMSFHLDSKSAALFDQYLRFDNFDVEKGVDLQMLLNALDKVDQKNAWVPESQYMRFYRILKEAAARGPEDKSWQQITKALKGVSLEVEGLASNARAAEIKTADDTFSNNIRDISKPHEKEIEKSRRDVKVDERLLSNDGKELEDPNWTTHFEELGDTPEFQAAAKDLADKVWAHKKFEKDVLKPLHDSKLKVPAGLEAKRARLESAKDEARRKLVEFVKAEKDKDVAREQAAKEKIATETEDARLAKEAVDAEKSALAANGKIRDSQQVYLEQDLGLHNKVLDAKFKKENIKCCPQDSQDADLAGYCGDSGRTADHALSTGANITDAKQDLAGAEQGESNIIGMDVARVCQKAEYKGKKLCAGKNIKCMYIGDGFKIPFQGEAYCVLGDCSKTTQCVRQQQDTEFTVYNDDSVEGGIAHRKTAGSVKAK